MLGVFALHFSLWFFYLDEGSQNSNFVLKMGGEIKVVFLANPQLVVVII